MYMGMGQSSFDVNADTSAFAESMGGSSVDVTPETAFTCPSGKTMVNGVCGANGLTTWLKNGNNGAYAALAAVAVVVVFGMMAKR